MRFEAPKVGKKEGRKVPVDEGLGVASAALSGSDSGSDSNSEVVSGAGTGVVCVGFWFTGRLVASVGGASGLVFVGAGATLVVIAIVSSMVWSSSCSSGRG